MLYLETAPGVFVLWAGQAIDGVVYPRTIGSLWSNEELAEIGLFKPVETEVPDGKRVVSSEVQRIDGVVQYVYTVETVPTGPSITPLSARQLRLGLIRNGIPLSAVEAAIDAIHDAQARDEARVWWEYSDQIEWGHEMTQSLMALMQLTQDQAAAMWMEASAYAA